MSVEVAQQFRVHIAVVESLKLVSSTHGGWAQNCL